jgi:hypothetical protein
MQQLLVQSVNNIKRPNEAFWLVVCHEGDRPEIRDFTDLDSLIAAIKSYDGQDVCVFPLLGFKMGISKPPMRHLITPFGHIPLFDLPDIDDLEEDDGFMGTRAVVQDIPAVAGEERGAYDDGSLTTMDEDEESLEDEYEDEEGEEGEALVAEPDEEDTLEADAAES